MKLKVCGMKYADNIEAVSELKPDFLGFIFYNKSARFFNGIIPRLPETIKKVGVFVDSSLDNIFSCVKKYDLNLVQLHGNENPDYCKNLQSQDLEVIKVFSVNDDFNFDELKDYEDACDYFLFDTKGKLPGGNGYTFNWEILQNYPSTKPFFLSGGIGLEELSDLKEFYKNPASKYCYAIDVNSKFEVKPGNKDIERLKKLKLEL